MFSRGLTSSLLSIGLLACSYRVQAGAPPQVAVNTKTYNGYARAMRPDGSAKSETYTIAEGGCWDFSDAESVKAVSFNQLVRILASTLGNQHYLPARSVDDADLMIAVFWGSTNADIGGDSNQDFSGPSKPAGAPEGVPTQSSRAAARAPADTSDWDWTMMQKRLDQDRQVRVDVYNAHILGYSDDYAYGMNMLGNGFTRGRDAIAEIRSNRYFIVLKAYDARLATGSKSLKLLWEARFSVDEKGNDFAEQAPNMARAAARYFGQDSKGLVRSDSPDGKVKVGTATVIPSAVPDGNRP